MCAQEDYIDVSRAVWESEGGDELLQAIPPSSPSELDKLRSQASDLLSSVAQGASSDAQRQQKGSDDGAAIPGIERWVSSCPVAPLFVSRRAVILHAERLIEEELEIKSKNHCEDTKDQDGKGSEEMQENKKSKGDAKLPIIRQTPVNPAAEAERQKRKMERQREQEKREEEEQMLFLRNRQELAESSRVLLLLREERENSKRHGAGQREANEIDHALALAEQLLSSCWFCFSGAQPLLVGFHSLHYPSGYDGVLTARWPVGTTTRMVPRDAGRARRLGEQAQREGHGA